ncbi:MAG: hypothetical protein AAGE52_13325 [Myxococcota bacterium]
MYKLALLPLVLALACGDDDGAGSMDTGTGGRDGAVGSDGGGGGTDGGGGGTDGGGGGTDGGGGGTDGGGGGTDGGGGRDSGSGRECEEPPMNIEDLDIDGMLLPRCSEDTRTALSECGDFDCAQSAAAADATPGISLGGGFSIDCSFCINIQLSLCVESQCPDENAALRCCTADNDCEDATCAACDDERAALDMCLEEADIMVSSCATLTDVCIDE